MNRLGIQSLNAGAPDLRLSGDQTQRGTYTQRRRTQMAGGGITQIGKPGGLVEPGISKYAWYDFVVDPVKDFVTEKAIPYVKDKIVDYGTGKVKDWLGIGDEPPRGGGPDPIPEYIPEELIYGMPQGSPYQLNQPTTQPTSRGPMGDPMWDLPTTQPTSKGPMGDPMWDTAKQVIAPNIPTIDELLRGDTLGEGMPPVVQTQPTRGPMGDPMWDLPTTQPTSRGPMGDPMWDLPTSRGPMGDPMWDLPTTQPTSKGPMGDPTDSTDIGGQQVQWKIPMAIGAAAGLAQEAWNRKQPPFPMDTTGIRFQTAQQAMADPTLRFKPEAQYANVAEGGRIGYNRGRVVNPGGYAGISKYEKDLRSMTTEQLETYNKNQGGDEMAEAILEERSIARNEERTQQRLDLAKELDMTDKEGVYGFRKEVPSQRFEDIREWMGSKKRDPRIHWSWEDLLEPLYKGGESPIKMERDIHRERYEGLSDEQLKRIYDISKRPTTDTGIATAAQGGRIGYREGEGVESIPVDQMQDIEGQTAEFKPVSIEDLIQPIYERLIAQGMTHEEASKEIFRILQGKAQGGRIGAQEGGLMNLGGMEKDYRQEGGFVPLGGQEKADDVPARLSKNEFVFTADAVRAAGGGDIDAGAEVMENVMENLEAGGKVSEESQGLEGARNMFANAQRLEKRII